jgi:hypothetical protein
MPIELTRDIAIKEHTCRIRLQSKKPLQSKGLM